MIMQRAMIEVPRGSWEGMGINTPAGRVDQLATQDVPMNHPMAKSVCVDYYY